MLFNYQFLTDKAIAGVVNVTHGSEDAALRAALEKEFGSRMSLSFFDAKLEAEIAAMADPEEREEFLSGMGIAEPAVAGAHARHLRGLGPDVLLHLAARTRCAPGPCARAPPRRRRPAPSTRTWSGASSAPST